MNAKITLNAPLVVSTDPVTGNITEFHSIEDFTTGCIDERNLKVKPESYIYSELPNYNCEECTVLPYVNPEQLSEIVGYAVKGIAKKYDTDQTPHKEIDSKEVSFLIGKAGVFASNTNNKYMPYVLGTDNINLFVKLAKAGESVVLHNDIDEAYQIINNGMPETIFRMMVGFNLSEQNQDLFVQVNDSFKTLPPNQIKQFFLDKKQQIEKSIESDLLIQPHAEGEPNQDATPQDWGELLPLSQSETVLNPYPIHALPPLAQEAVRAISEHVQSPIAMTAQCVIGAMSHIAQAQVNAPHPFNAHGEPCSLFLLTEGQSGSRKSTSRNLADQAIIKHERKQYEAYRQELEQWKSGQAGLPKKDREAYCAENPPPNDPSTLYSDITLESIAGLFIDGVLSNASIASDEAGQFFGGHSMKADTRNQALGGYAKLFDDGFVERTRSKSNLNGSGRAYDVRLTFNLQGQHEVLAEALKDPVLRGQGFLPRFILTIPENLAGTRLQDAIYRNKNASTDHRLIAYWTRCEYLLDDCPQVKAEHELHNGRYVLPMNDEAREIDAAFYNMFEELQGKGKRYEYLQAFASRASQLARRLATVFAYFEGLQWIDAKTLKGACEVVKHSLNEWAMYAEIEVKAESDAEKLIKWIAKKCNDQKTDRIAYSNVQTSCPRPMQKNKNLLEMVIQQLEDSHYIKIESIGRTRYVVIHPFLVES
ncbi:YfjI family protein [Acinetobacter sp. YH12142]|uniref:YfjI family protein n=1 Tax=Acinetobacter sp. YH12142 TaxID=2601126 RepID=UPI00211F3D4E|nr:YfjI family protein [Acinetobacter sp. YH12142]